MLCGQWSEATAATFVQKTQGIPLVSQGRGSFVLMGTRNGPNALRAGKPPKLIWKEEVSPSTKGKCWALPHTAGAPPCHSLWSPASPWHSCPGGSHCSADVEGALHAKSVLGRTTSRSLHVLGTSSRYGPQERCRLPREHRAGGWRLSCAGNSGPGVLLDGAERMDDRVGGP